KPRGGIEDAQFTELLDLMQTVTLTPISDMWIWTLEGSRDFLVASIRTEIDNKILKANVHAWKVKLYALPTRLNISRRGIDVKLHLVGMTG
nr:hypothetical protein [Tanacetum cinerariifolium]